jgi:hypothetical protein
MKRTYRYSAEGGASILIVPLFLAVLFLVAAVAFGGWAYSQMQDYKNNVDAKVNTAVKQAIQAEDTKQAALFAGEEKSPFRTYQGPAAYGSIMVKYPKTWSAYVIDGRNSSPYIDGYFYPNTVPDTQAQSSAFALRIQVVDQSYSDALTLASSAVETGQATVAPYSLPNVTSIVGAKIEGQLATTTSQKSGTMVILPLRNMTLEIWTESTTFEDDFQNIILKNFTFAP